MPSPPNCAPGAGCRNCVSDHPLPRRSRLPERTGGQHPSRSPSNNPANGCCSPFTACPNVIYWPAIPTIASAKKPLGWSPSGWNLHRRSNGRLAFQSRFGRAQWLRPYTSASAGRLGQNRRQKRGRDLPRLRRRLSGNAGRNRHRKPAIFWKLAANATATSRL
jgi:hypothetical protein